MTSDHAVQIDDGRQFCAHGYGLETVNAQLPKVDRQMGGTIRIAKVDEKRQQ